MHHRADQDAQRELTATPALSGISAEPTALTREDFPMNAHTQIRPAKGGRRRVRSAAEAAIQSRDFDTVMRQAMASARTCQDAYATQKRLHDEREAISRWSDYAAAERAAQDAVAFPAILEVDGGPWVGSAGAVVAVVKRYTDGTEERIELPEASRKTQLMTRDAITGQCGGDPGTAQPMLAALEKYHADRRAAAKAVFNAMPPRWRELTKQYDRAHSAGDRLQTQMKRDVFAALKFPTGRPEHVQQKVELISLAFKDELPTSLHRPDRARPSYEPEEILAVTLGAIVRDLSAPPPADRTPLGNLIAEYRGVVDRMDKGELDDKSAERALEETLRPMFAAAPRDWAELAALIEFFKQEEDDDPEGISWYCGKRPIEHLYNAAQALMATSRLPKPDGAGLARIWQEWEAARDAYCEFDPETDAEELDDAAFAPVVAAEVAILTTPCQSLSDAAVKLQMILYGMRDGETVHDESAMEDVIAFLGGPVTTDLPAEWSEVLAAWPNDLALREVVQFAIRKGYTAEQLTQTIYASPELPGWAPALYFGLPNGDTAIVTRHGVQTMFARDGEPVTLPQRLAAE